ncbi:MAG: hypothetical protein ACR2NM_04260, partial [Bythopirellula sp.]
SNTGLPFGKPPKQPLRQSLPVQQADPNVMEVVAGSPAELQLAQFQAQATSVAPPALLHGSAATTAAQPTQPRVRFGGLTPPTAIRVGSVEELELRLSQAVVSPPPQWELSPLEAAANSLLSETKTPSVRAQLREVLDRITRFQEVQDRYNTPAPPPLASHDPFESAPAPPTDLSPALTGMSASVRERIREDLRVGGKRVAGAKPPGTADGLRYDATGLLKPVVSKRENAPQYALVDEKGKVVSFVTPTPDLNLKPYVGRRIGVNGTRGFMPEYRRAHVTAGRVTPIEQNIRR